MRLRPAELTGFVQPGIGDKYAIASVSSWFTDELTVPATNSRPVSRRNTDTRAPPTDRPEPLGRGLMVPAISLTSRPQWP